MTPEDCASFTLLPCNPGEYTIRPPANEGELGCLLRWLSWDEDRYAEENNGRANPSPMFTGGGGRIVESGGGGDDNKNAPLLLCVFSNKMIKNVQVPLSFAVLLPDGLHTIDLLCAFTRCRKRGIGSILIDRVLERYVW